ncbi:MULTISPECIES: helix-turn-helix domain-containing protein [Bacillus cereus group]|uniref:helix-turn-helix domain-containing protein n=1 Tax=Bacillus cereus group TaxID=86661 RepID=UPI000ACD9180|nr:MULTISPECIES: helix-turn-helix transcriptional regulator [Bacillus cereus group]MDA2611353.1 helix-turn-helix transcriptional regulator [Bacillus cereus]MEB8554790.1 helix-turn-helix transcriptional regulator [Bacillus cereus]MEB8725298.1 helix-turn-helix transcriptional regulator [Bacillus cereus]MEB8820207.1 helix-turn-helix transcriptional regulator [Bacillus cereus]MEB8972304.1 helix-turn-helix transcriptional regulator [Bacillus cereus]
MAKRIEVKLRDILKSRGMDQKDLIDKDNGLSTRTISELASGKMKRYPKEVLEKIADKLNITDMNELLLIVEAEEDIK